MGSDRKTMSYAEDWGCLFPDRMAWDVNTNKYVLSQFGMKFNALYTDAIPLASSTTDGLVSKGDKKDIGRHFNRLGKPLQHDHDAWPARGRPGKQDENSSGKAERLIRHI